MPQSNDGRRGFEAGAVLARGVRVKIVAAKVVVTGDDELGIGTTTNAAAAIGDTVNVRLDNHSVEGVAGAAIAQFAEVQAGALGKIITKAAGARVGIALEAGAADGDFVEYMPIQA